MSSFCFNAHSACFNAKNYNFKLTFEKMMQLEQILSCHIAEIVKKFTQSTYSIQDVIEVLYISICSENQIDKKEFSSDILEEGLHYALKQVINILSLALNGKKSLERREKT